MMKEQEYQRRSNQVNSFRQNNQNNSQSSQGNQGNQGGSQSQGSSHGRPHRNFQEQGSRKENSHFRSYNKENRDNFQRNNYQSQSGSMRHSSRIKTEETITDIQSDIVRIEKEIQLELKEIRSMRLGM